MKALILVGGYGTRLRPFTFSLPKPLVPFANKAIVFHQMEALIKVGVKEIILAVNVKPDDLVREVDKFAAEHKVSVFYSKEDVPLGTAGPLALARKYLVTEPAEDGSGNRVPSSAPFFMFNSDVICDFPLEAMLNFHHRNDAEGTILSTEVSDPSKYGVIVPPAEGPIDSFVEKPTGVAPSNRINAGIYLLNPAVVSLVKDDTPMSIEREVFPRMLAPKKTLFSMHLPGYWMDIGQPKDYLIGTRLHLASVQKSHPERLLVPTPKAPASTPSSSSSSVHPVITPDAVDRKDRVSSPDGKERKASPHKVRVIDNVMADPSSVIGENSEIGPDVIIGKDCKIGRGVRLQRTTLMDGVVVGDGAFIKDSIIGWRSNIGEWARVEGSSLGEDVQVAREVFLNQTVVLPHKGVAGSILTPNQIIM